jgi:hypothetical protein
VDVGRRGSRHLRLVGRIRANPAPSNGLLECPVDDYMRSPDRRRSQRLAVLAASLPQLPVQPVDVFGPEPRYLIRAESRLDVPTYEAGGL